MDLKTTNKTVLRRMLRARDRKLGWWKPWMNGFIRDDAAEESTRLDTERKQIRLAIKAHLTTPPGEG